MIKTDYVGKSVTRIELDAHITGAVFMLGLIIKPWRKALLLYTLLRVVAIIASALMDFHKNSANK